MSFFPLHCTTELQPHRPWSCSDPNKLDLATQPLEEIKETIVKCGERRFALGKGTNKRFSDLPLEVLA